MQELKKVVDGLVAQYGEEAVAKTVQVLLNRSEKSIPAAHIPVLDPVKLHETVSQLDSATAEILAAGTTNEAIYRNKADLIGRLKELNTEIQIAESEAFMQIQGEGKDTFALIGGLKVALTNDKTRDAYKIAASKTLREELAKVESQISKIDVELSKAKEIYYSKQEASLNIRAKANLQASLLNFLK